MQHLNALRVAPRPLTCALLAAGLCAFSTTHAASFDWGNGVAGSFDSTISLGNLWRMSERDASLIGIANGGTSRSVNGDDGNLNYHNREIVSSLIKGTHELEIKYRNYGFFTRGSWYYDRAAADKDELGPKAHSRLRRDVVLLDAYAYGRFDFGGQKSAVRVGNQVVSWGESTFLANSINSINPVDVSKLRAPGSELKEAFIPTPMIWASQQIGSGFSVEGYYQANWQKTRLDPRGSFFSTTDALSDDGDKVYVTFGRRKDQHFPVTNPSPTPALAAAYGPFDPAAAVWLPRGDDRTPSNSGQFGGSLRYLASALNNTEFGAYYLNYHSRTPIVSVRKTTFPALGSGTTNLLTGSPFIPVAANTANGSASVFAEYPENIHLVGLSFNSAGPLGIALQGEYSFRKNQPVQMGVTDLVLSSLNLPSQNAQNPADIPLGSEITGYRRVNMHQVQVTATKAIPQILAAEQFVIVGEVGYNYLNLPSDVEFEGYGTLLPVLQSSANAAAGGSAQPGGWATKSSWGYRLAARLEYPNAFGGVNVIPRLAFSHDVDGVGPNFNKGAKAATVGVGFTYQQNWQADVAYTNFFGGRVFCGTDVAALSAATLAARQSLSFCSSANSLKDRDFLAINISYSF
ncbi:MAG: DUF1302 domain-containing protein [Betaproteobacteria bacterium]